MGKYLRVLDNKDLLFKDWQVLLEGGHVTFHLR